MYTREGVFIPISFQQNNLHVAKILLRYVYAVLNLQASTFLSLIIAF